MSIREKERGGVSQVLIGEARKAQSNVKQPGI